MPAVTDYAENLVLDAILGDDHGGSIPDVIYVALFTSDPTEAGSGTEVSDDGTGYARVEVENDTTNWPAAASSTKVNGTTITFPEVEDDWGIVTHWAIFDAATGGNALLYGELAVPVTPTPGPAPYFVPGSLIIGCD